VKKVQPYKSLIHTLRSLKAQSLEGGNFMKKNIPTYISEPRDLFYFLKDRVTYKNDPKGIELIHSPESLFHDNYHGKPGSGDCDDFTMLSIAGLKAMGVPEAQINVCLTGRSKTVPRHIYLNVKGTPFDLTNDLYGEERPYPYKQEIPLNRL
jgi:transglutaminase-like putative cysteine protease